MRPGRRRRIGLSLGTLLLLACTEGLAPGDQLLGEWGSRSEGQQLLFVATADSATLRLPCAVAQFAGPITLGADTTFDIGGTVDYGYQRAAARLVGRGRGAALELTLTQLDVPYGIPARYEVRRGVRPDFGRTACMAE